MASRLLVRPAPMARFTVTGLSRSFSVFYRPPSRYEGHVPLNSFERCALAAGSAIMSLIDPTRAGKLLLNALYSTG